MLKSIVASQTVGKFSAVGRLADSQTSPGQQSSCPTSLPSYTSQVSVEAGGLQLLKLYDIRLLTPYARKACSMAMSRRTSAPPGFRHPPGVHPGPVANYYLTVLRGPSVCSQVCTTRSVAYHSRYLAASSYLNNWESFSHCNQRQTMTDVHTCWMMKQDWKTL